MVSCTRERQGSNVAKSHRVDEQMKLSTAHMELRWPMRKTVLPVVDDVRLVRPDDDVVSQQALPHTCRAQPSLLVSPTQHSTICAFHQQHVRSEMCGAAANDPCAHTGQNHAPCLRTGP
eukprot:2600826-Rhodomonas_salina.2